MPQESSDLFRASLVIFGYMLIMTCLVIKDIANKGMDVFYQPPLRSDLIGIIVVVNRVDTGFDPIRQLNKL